MLKNKELEKEFQDIIIQLNKVGEFNLKIMKIIKAKQNNLKDINIEDIKKIKIFLMLEAGVIHKVDNELGDFVEKNNKPDKDDEN